MAQVLCTNEAAVSKDWPTSIECQARTLSHFDAFCIESRAVAGNASLLGC